MKKVVWGVLSTARIGREKVIPAMQAASLCDMHAIASRSLARAQHTAGALGIPVAYGSYEELFADPAIEAIYNPLPNDQHVALTLQAARAGKHVLCEKPLALDADQAAQLREVATRVHIMEAFMVRFHPQWAHVRERVRCGDLGAVRSIQTWFSYFNKQADNIRNHVDQGGGALYDIGCYAVVTARYLFECEPQRVIALVDRDPEFGTDRTISALLDFGAGRRLDDDAQLLLRAPLTPMCAPAIAARVQTVADLGKEVLLRSYRTDEWSAWFQEAESIPCPALRGMVFDSSITLAEAAALGCGVALLPSRLFARELMSGRLVRLFPQELDCGGYWLTRLKSRTESGAMQVFGEWLRAGVLAA